jgi:pullulanase
MRLYKYGIGGGATDSLRLQQSTGGTWATTIRKNIRNAYYTFQVMQDGHWLDEKPDIYATAVGVNGVRGQVIDMSTTDPAGWKGDKRPALKTPTDIILYEMQIRDLTIARSSGSHHPGTFLGVAERGTHSPQGATTGLDHMKELGITHLHILPAFDFNSVDETRLSTPQYNWGYDPVNYNVPEGSFSSNPSDGGVRIREFKTMVQAVHKAGIRVVLDVVYNHTANRNSGFNAVAPQYFYRMKPNGDYSDATGCGNETASERAMMRQFMIQSLVHWVNEYHIDGFRFDLMGVHDIETMNLIADTLHRIDQTIFLYGEGWTAGGSPLPEDQRAVKANVSRLHNIAAFSDDIRDGLHGPWNKNTEKGFVSGNAGWAESVKFGIVASTQHSQVNYGAVNYSKTPWAAEPAQAIAYASCHDDNTLFDRLKLANPQATEAELIRMDRLAQTAVLLSQGVPFLHGGAELLRTKKGVGNSYNAPDSINQIDWTRKTTYKNVYEYYRGLIAIRKAHPSFRMPTAALIRQKLRFVDTGDANVIGYTIQGVKGDAWKEIVVLLNGAGSAKSMTLPPGAWKVAANGETINQKGLKTVTGTVTLGAVSGWVLFR